MPNLGDAAFWRSDAKSGALYVLKGNIYLRVVTGGNDDGETKIESAARLCPKHSDDSRREGVTLPG